MSFSSPGQPPSQHAPLTAETDASGNFAFRDLEAGSYQISGQLGGIAHMPPSSN